MFTLNPFRHTLYARGTQDIFICPNCQTEQWYTTLYTRTWHTFFYLTLWYQNTNTPPVIQCNNCKTIHEGKILRRLTPTHVTLNLQLAIRAAYIQIYSTVAKTTQLQTNQTQYVGQAIAKEIAPNPYDGKIFNTDITYFQTEDRPQAYIRTIHAYTDTETRKQILYKLTLNSLKMVTLNGTGEAVPTIWAPLKEIGENLGLEEQQIMETLRTGLAHMKAGTQP